MPYSDFRPLRLTSLPALHDHLKPLRMKANSDAVSRFFELRGVEVEAGYYAGWDMHRDVPRIRVKARTAPCPPSS